MGAGDNFLPADGRVQHRTGFLESLDEGQLVLYLQDLYNVKGMTLMEIGTKWGLSAMSVSRHRHNPKLMGARNKAAKQNYEKALVKAQKKTGVGSSLASVQERAQHVFEVADMPNIKGQRDVKGMVEALKVELETVRTIAEIGGLLNKEQAPAQVTVTTSPQFMIAMPRLEQAQIRGDIEVVEAELIEERPGREDVRTLEDEQEG